MTNEEFDAIADKMVEGLPDELTGDHVAFLIVRIVMQYCDEPGQAIYLMGRATGKMAELIRSGIFSQGETVQ